ncbi:PAS domain S-box protein [Hymenobacter sp. YC55]|uniref:PAS domain S-box protein n=1 Tax=Hymenobacter sp. YC55 TaxID=3034019 RepID=UPI0023F9CF2F|nr:PAS domain S-box protein [Hymenobacter sp. YC55]MDF7811709.1 PAS domain S-box protein [Hymenobacter sp. YC55]
MQTTLFVDFQATFEALPGNFLLLQPNAPDYTVLAVSEELLRSVHKERQQVVGSSVFVAFPENPEALAATGASELRKSLNHVRQEKELYELPVVRYDVPNPDGVFEERYWSASSKPVLSSAGEVLYIVHTTTDITAQQQAEKSTRALRQIEKTYSLFMQAPVAVCIVTGPDNIVELANEELHQFLGTTPAIIGQPLFDVLPEAKTQGFPELLEQVRTTAEPYCGTEYPVTLHLNGQKKLRYYNFVCHPYYANPTDTLAAGVFSVAHNVTQQVLARQQAAESESRFRSLVEQMPVPIGLTRGQEMVFDSINDPMLQMLGKSGSMVLGKPLLEVLPELGSQAVIALLDQVQKTGEPFHGHEVPVLLQINNEPKPGYYNLSYTPLRERGQITGVIHVAFDVTEQVQARQKLEESEQELKWFEFMAGQALDPFLLLRQDGSFAYLNKQALEAWGYTQEEARHLRIFDIDPLYQQEAYAQIFAQAQQGPYPRFDTLHKRKDGHVYPVNVSMSGLVLEGQPYLFAIPRDITEQKQFTDALRESEQRFRTMADAAPNIVWAVNPDVSVKYVNKAFLEFLGVTLEHFIASNWLPHVHPEDLQLTRRTLMGAVQDRAIFSLEHRMLRQDGEYRWLLSQGAPSYYASGELYGYVGSAIDITELKEANEQLTRLNIDLDNFIYTASHDLKAPISNIEGLLDALLHTLPPETLQMDQVQILIGMMQESADRFSKTIANLTDVVKLQKEYNGEAVLVDLAGIVEAVRLDLESMIKGTGAVVKVDVAACPAVRFSEKNMRSVVYNLFSNALKYRAPDRTPQVLISCESTPQYLVLTVQDNGLGIEPQRQKQLFTMFKRFHDHVEGSGIGLYMVKKMVENAGGKIEVESQPGVGSTFRIYFRR